MKTSPQKIIAGLDIGTSIIRVAIGRPYEDGIEIVGIGQSPSRGMRNGEILDLKSISDAIRIAVNEAEFMARCKVKNVVVGIADESINSQFSQSEVPFTQGIVRVEDIREVIQSAGRSPLPSDRELLHISPGEFIIDKQVRTIQPAGMAGSLLGVKAQLITVDSTTIKNIANACKLAGLREFKIALMSPATAETLLLPEEREQGVVHIDIGVGPIKIAVYSYGALRFYKRSWDLGRRLTADIAIGLRIPISQSDQVKRLYGCCLMSMVNSEEMMELPPYKEPGNRFIPKTFLAEIIESRVGDALSIIAKELQPFNQNGELVGVVITGGNSQLPGLKELASQVLNMPVRIGSSRSIEGVTDSVSSPDHSTAVGLVLLGAKTDGSLQGIKKRGGNLLVLRTTLALKSMLKKFK